MSRKNRITMFDVVVHIIGFLLTIIVLYPLILVLSCSFSDPDLVMSGQVVLLPKGLTLEGYKAVFENDQIMLGYANTFFYTIFGTIVRLLVTLPAGYALSKGNRLPGYNKLLVFFMISMYFSGGLIPTFLWVNKLGLYNTRLYIIIHGAFSMYNCVICRSFFAAIPKELEEAAYIDGSSVTKTFAKVVMPLSKALLGVMVLYMAIGQWNSYFVHMVYLREDSKMPLAVFLRRILVLSQQITDSEDAEYIAMLIQREQLIRYAVIVVAAAPLLIIYPFLQKYFDKGVLIGSVKG